MRGKGNLEKASAELKRKRDAHQQIAFLTEQGEIVTKCPHIGSVRVGSIACQRCSHFTSMDKAHHHVTCSFMGDMADQQRARTKDGPNV